MTAGFADDPAIDEPESMAERRDHITELNAARAEGARAERERMRRLLNAERLEIRKAINQAQAKTGLAFARLFDELVQP